MEKNKTVRGGTVELKKRSGGHNCYGAVKLELENGNVFCTSCAREFTPQWKTVNKRPVDGVTKRVR